ncbi:putative [histone H3]-lysine(4) N-trimethyltransferase chromatin remodeling SET family [Helianthus annuus]|uniref:Histone-lysine N-methyltransferase chromatin remodeling SET family n=1 Tax=Helianthus annuus TaxID=4232 RepID=A0A251UK16_HELAN|nr:histone-lysine N-methyltransferase family member SUVH9 [Helianthus annuus]XP_021970568.1 histone-lysine N-methyltransferase family member SUVH9 [Helianthus annuus]XP_035830511.1 histone-lysine N-methyltransferase family member SUVH9 [Helianthus annuus]KAF5803573.1 putative histone-lysine N-methyltransferase chromatin remodeling SET family [Helianthus annuus]KAJ0561508.1 putative [histone H3]-lysine(4) N-trimethyltransferase chromatin remodeling SET family [Helianthus annuus]KAJ0574568.1 put
MTSFIDLNLYPDSPVSETADVTTALTLTVPKLEPKEEPFDELPQSHNNLHTNPNLNYTNPNLNFTLNTQADVSHEHVNETDVYSEFNRISKMFQTAFSGKAEKFDDNRFTDPDSRAIVPVPEENLHTAVADSSRRKNQQRSGELVRVTNLGFEDERYFRHVVRKTRMMYDSLRVLVNMEDEKRKNSHVFGRSRSARGDLRAATVMKERGLWLNRDKRIVGAIPGVYVGDIFFFRMEICVVGMHGLPQAGIDYLTSSQSSNGDPIATSIIVSGGYEDDQDAGDVIIYTGHGGQDKYSRQANHQRLEGGNLAMERSMHYGIEVRVVRGFRYEGSPSGKVYVYDGLYKVVDSWLETGKSGFGVIKFKLIRMDNQPEMGSAILKYAESFRKGSLQSMPRGYASMDISMKKENMPVFLFNDIDDNHEPTFYEYLATSVFPPFVYHHGGNGNNGGCNCFGGCTDGCFCAKRNGGDFAYDQSGLLVRGKPLIFECGPHCRCPPHCRNRVSQNGVKNRFEVFRSKETGWGVRSLDLIQAGSFICEYTGVILTREQAQLFSMNGDSLIYPNRFGERWAEWGDLSQIFSDYERPSYPSVPPLDFAMDVSRMRNVACYMSHSVCPNVLVQLVLYDHSNIAFPHLMLFAMENIPPMRELSLDYGEADEWTGKLSICN